MLRIIPVVFLLLLSGCGYHGCMSQQDVMNDTIRSVVYTNPKQSSDGSRRTWVKVDFPMSGNIRLNVEYYNVNFCSDAEVSELKLEASPGDALTSGRTKLFPVDFPVRIMPKEKVKFSLIPVRSFTVDDAICRNQDDDIYTVDAEECRKRDIGQQRTINFSRKLVDKYGFMNSWYEVPKDSMSSPFIEGFYPHVIPGNEAEVSRGGALSSLNERDEAKYLCYSDYDIELEAKGGSASNAVAGEIDYASKPKRCTVKCQPFGRYGYRPGSRELPTGCYKACVHYSSQQSSSSGGGGGDRLHAVREKVRSIQDKYKRAMDEFAINGYCGVLKTVGEYAPEGSSSGGTKKNHHAYHLLSYSKNTNQVATVLPFVKFDGGSSSRHHGKLVPAALQYESGSSIMAPSESGSEQGGIPLVKLSAGKGDAIKAFPDIDDYLELERDYEIGSSTAEVHGFTLKLEPPSSMGDNKMLVGSYRLKVKKDCSAHLQDSLYYTFSEDYPGYEPGAGGSHKIDFMDKEEIFIKDLGNGGDLYYGVKDNGDGADNNTGYFEIKAVVAKVPPKFFSHIVKWTEGRVRSALYGNKDGGQDSVIAKMYRHISRDGQFLRLVNAILILYVMISALYFFLGFSRASIFQLFVIFAKVIIVVYVIRPDSWTFFNDHLFKLFTNAPKEFISIMTGGVGHSDDFGFMDGILYRFTVSQTWIQLLALLFAGPVGWLTVVLIFWGLFLLVECMFDAVVIYLISMMLIALLLCLAPFFLICVLFKRTKAIFDAWIKVLLQTAMQPVLIFSCIALMVQVVNNVIYAMLNFQVCDACVLSIDIKIATLCVLNFLLPVGIVPAAPVGDVVRELYNTGNMVLIGIPGSIFNVLIFIAIANATRDFVINSGEMCSIMFGAFTNLSDVGAGAAQAMLSVVGMDKMTGQMVEQQKHQLALFSRGAGAGREESFASRLMPTAPRGGHAGEAAKRKPIVHPVDPPASF
ncbi:type IV secretion system protein [Anaplasma capra]|nr:type IV secretion system protein [Anaplasma capra]